MDEANADRRRFPRLKAPVYFREARLFSSSPKLIDVSRGGIRAFTDEALNEGAKLELTLFSPDTSSASCVARVVWVHRLPEGGPSTFEVGLEFLQVSRALLEQLPTLVDGAEGDEATETE